MKKQMMLYLNTSLRTPPSVLVYKGLFNIKRCYSRKIKEYSYNGLWGCINTTLETFDFDEDFIARFDKNAISHCKFSFLNVEHQLKDGRLTDFKEASDLWMFNLHYFEYAFALIEGINKGEIKPTVLKGLILSWIESNKTGGSGWHPYTISVRLPAFMATAKCFAKDEQFQKLLINSIYTQYKYLAQNIELHHKGSNHYLENLKTLVAGAAFFGIEKDFTRYFEAYKRELFEQVNNDGMHCELSPMYHRLVLEGAIKVYYWYLQAVGGKNHELAIQIKRMCSAMYSIEKGTNRIPFFNDSAEGVAKGVDSLLKAAREICGVTPTYISSFEHSGYYLLENQGFKVIADCGEIGAKTNPGHGHCDVLSYELFFEGTPIIVNSGTYTYKNCKLRQDFRSTRYHNTIVVNGMEQSEIWSSFRVARRSKVVEAFVSENKFYGEIYTYNYVKHSREISINDTHSCTICDKVSSENWIKDIKSYIHVHPCFTLNNINGIIYFGMQGSCLGKDFADNKFSFLPVNSRIVEAIIGKEENGWYSTSFGVKEPAPCIVLEPIDVKKPFGYKIQRY